LGHPLAFFGIRSHNDETRGARAMSPKRHHIISKVGA
jgi:hypothetical protein